MHVMAGVCGGGGGGSVRGRGACVVGGMHGGGWGVGMCGGEACMAGGCAWRGGRAWQILRDTVNERAVRILLECILVYTYCTRRQLGRKKLWG